jgi:hypothetical protein
MIRIEKTKFSFGAKLNETDDGFVYKRPKSRLFFSQEDIFCIFSAPGPDWSEVTENPYDYGHTLVLSDGTEIGGILNYELIVEKIVKPSILQALERAAAGETLIFPIYKSIRKLTPEKNKIRTTLEISGSGLKWSHNYLPDVRWDQVKAIVQFTSTYGAWHLQLATSLDKHMKGLYSFPINQFNCFCAAFPILNRMIGQ